MFCLEKTILGYLMVAERTTVIERIQEYDHFSWKALKEVTKVYSMWFRSISSEDASHRHGGQNGWVCACLLQSTDDEV